MSQFSQFVQSQNLSIDHIFYCSARIERHRVSDRQLRLQREERRRAGQAVATDVGKPRSGRGVSRQRIEAALSGQALPPRVRAKLTRAVATLAARKGAAAPDVRQLFGDAQTRHGGAAPVAAASGPT
jgi:hypothetical protein